MSDSHDSTDEPSGVPPSGDGLPESGAAPREDEVSLLDILLVLARHKGLIVRTLLAFTILGLTYSIFASEEYTSEARVVREAQQRTGGGNLPGGLSQGVLSGLGISLGGSGSGLTPAAFPSVLESREVRLAVVRDTFRFPDTERPMTFVEYANRPPGIWDLLLKYTLKLPFTLKKMLGKAVSGAPSSTSPAPAGTTENNDPIIPSKKEETAIKAVRGKIFSGVNEKTGLMSISVTAGGAQLALDLTKSFLDHFTTRVRELRTEKVRERLEFVEQRFQEVEKELDTAEERLARFLERNQNPTTATLRFQRDRLQRQVTFKEQLYSELQSQLTQTRLDLQQRQPVITVVENPVAPTGPSAPNRTLLVFLSVVLGGFFGVLLAFIKNFFENAEEKEGDQEKLEEVRERLIPARFRKTKE
jgi:uncharacterized protein involved in exopolysaccharide biosynthesis